MSSELPTSPYHPQSLDSANSDSETHHSRNEAEGEATNTWEWTPSKLQSYRASSENRSYTQSKMYPEAESVFDTPWERANTETGLKRLPSELHKQAAPSTSEYTSLAARADKATDRHAEKGDALNPRSELVSGRLLAKDVVRALAGLKSAAHSIKSNPERRSPSRDSRSPQDGKLVDSRRGFTETVELPGGHPLEHVRSNRSLPRSDAQETQRFKAFLCDVEELEGPAVMSIPLPNGVGNLQLLVIDGRIAFGAALNGHLLINIAKLPPSTDSESPRLADRLQRQFLAQRQSGFQTKAFWLNRKSFEMTKQERARLVSHLANVLVRSLSPRSERREVESQSVSFSEWSLEPVKVKADEPLLIKPIELYLAVCAALETPKRTSTRGAESFFQRLVQESDDAWLMAQDPYHNQVEDELNCPFGLSTSYSRLIDAKRLKHRTLAESNAASQYLQQTLDSAFLTSCFGRPDQQPINDIQASIATVGDAFWCALYDSEFACLVRFHIHQYGRVVHLLQSHLESNA